MRTLLFSTLYPSSERPGHGIFVETRLRELLKTGQVDARVVAPVPWFPSGHSRFGEHAAMARTPHRETRHGIDVLHPRYALLPKIGMSSAPLMLALGARRAVQRLRDEGFDFDLIDAHYFYPDGVAAALLARWFRRPLVITARGSDVNLIAQHALPRRLMRWAAGCAAANVGVSAALAQRLLALGAPPPTVQVLRNGVDTERFSPQPEARQQLGVQGSPLLLSVGNLLPVKRHGLVIQALALLRQTHPQARLVIVGGGPQHAELQAQAAALGLADAVQLPGPVPQPVLAQWYSAADLLVLASSREGWPNVLLEAMACGTPVLASRVGGVPEIVSHDSLGKAVSFDTPAQLAEALRGALAFPYAREEVRRHALGMGWGPVSRAQVELFSRVAASGAAQSPVGAGGSP
ncbi:glycosyltransferase [Rubrivivax rivuli]|uniref:Glycosyltransferase family 4 protein n=1 Tax=Rubrivivax rivuli TaxID=1862385 RepID=A0A437RSZ7_9BURK|nr:glycosyltransferase [Rubrivivax rivuli]RVU49824.1 glycosyltransferase family 4 protein [Rubrivivax rivuli]